jgi:endonuclease YncB( thermonuclease family)
MPTFFSNLDRVLVILVLSTIPAYASEIKGTVKVINGNTLEIGRQKIRLYGVSTPDSSQICLQSNGEPKSCVEQARLKLSEYTKKKTVNCAPKAKDNSASNESIVAVCHRDQTDLNKWLVLQGLALADRKYGLDYIDAEDQARSNKAGIWQGFTCQGKQTCREMDSCVEAIYYLTECRVSRLDGDKNAIPCENLCRQ